jgi:peptidoglycan/LPS O-acetylase OafA/YrhL
MVSTVFVSRNGSTKPRITTTGRQSDRAPDTPQFRSDIEGMRAVAVVLVVLYHAGVRTLGGGYVGVDVFFVISGFLITTQLYNELLATRRISVARFYARRATRLLPASTLVLLATVIAAWFWLPPTRFKSLTVDALASTFYGINWRLAAQGVDYLSVGAPPSPLQHFWSLAVEEQFYLVWPVLLLALSVAWGRQRRRSALGRHGLVAALVVLCGVSFAASVQQTRAVAPWAYFGAHTRAWELALGALIAVTAPYLARLPKVPAAAATWLGLLAVVGSATCYTDTTPYPGYAAALPVVGTGLIIAAGSATPVGGVVMVLRHQPFQLVGKLSYSWYLWHWPILLIAPVALHLTASVEVNLALAAASMAVAAISFRLVENPIRSCGSLKVRPWRGVFLGVSLSAGAAAVALTGSYLPLTPGRGGPAPDTRAVVSRAREPARKLAELVRDGVSTTVVPSNLTPSLTGAHTDRPAVYRDGCHLNFAAVKAAKLCAYGDTAAARTVVLFGDSHAAQWFPALNQIAKTRHWRLLSLTKSACPAASVLVYLDALKRGYTECVQWRDRTLATIRQLRPGTVIMANNGTDNGGLVNPPVDPDRAWADAWVASLRQVSQPGTKVIVLSDTPYPKSNVPDCISTHVTHLSECVRQRRDALIKPRRRGMVAAAAGRSGATVIDPTPWFCTTTQCPVVVGNILVYKDESHMSTAYSTMLARVLAARLP